MEGTACVCAAYVSQRSGAAGRGLWGRAAGTGGRDGRGRWKGVNREAGSTVQQLEACKVLMGCCVGE